MVSYSDNDIGVVYELSQLTSRSTMLNPVPKDTPFVGRGTYKHWQSYLCSSLLQEKVEMVLLKAPELEMTGRVMITRAAPGWQCGWTQSMVTGLRTARYGDATQELHIRGSPLPCRDATVKGWPFSDTPVGLPDRGSTMFQVSSSDDPSCYFPVLHPRGRSRITRIKGSYRFHTHLVLWHQERKRLVVLGGFDWELDFRTRLRWEPDLAFEHYGTGLTVGKMPSDPVAFDNFTEASTVNWKSRPLQITREILFNRLQESFDALTWCSHTDHTDSEGKPVMNWVPSSFGTTVRRTGPPPNQGGFGSGFGSRSGGQGVGRGGFQMGSGRTGANPDINSGNDK